MDNLKLECHKLLMKVSWKVIRQTRKNLSQLGFGWHQYVAMRCIQPGESVTLSEIGTRISKENSNVTTLVDSLEEKGIVRRVSDRADRRVVRVRLTEEGELIRERITGEHEEFIRRMYSSLSKEDMDHLVGIMTIMDEKIRE